MSEKLSAVTDEQKTAAKEIFASLAVNAASTAGFDAKIEVEKSALEDERVRLIVALHAVAGGRPWKGPDGVVVTPVVRVKKKTGEQEVFLRGQNVPTVPVEI